MLGHSHCLQKLHYAHIGPSATAPAAAPAATKERATNLFNYQKRIRDLIFFNCRNIDMCRLGRCSLPSCSATWVRGLNHWVSGLHQQHPKDWMDTYLSIIYMRTGTHGFYPTISALHARQRGQFALWNCGRGDFFGSHGQQRGQAAGRVRLSLGTRGMQMAAGLFGHHWSPLVCRHAACSGCAREPQDHRRIGCLQQRDGLMQTAHLLLLPGRKRWRIQSRKESQGNCFLDQDFVACFRKTFLATCCKVTLWWTPGVRGALEGLGRVCYQSFPTLKAGPDWAVVVFFQTLPTFHKSPCLNSPPNPFFSTSRPLFPWQC